MENNERDEFYKKLESYYTYKPGKKPYTIDEMNTMIQDLINAKTNRKKKTRHEYYLLEKYDVLSVANKRYLKCKNKKEQETKFLVPYEELYEVIREYHTKTGHGGNVKLRTVITKYAVPRPAIEAFLLTCSVCSFKRETKQHKLTIEPVVSKTFNKRGHLHLVNFQSIPDGKFNWILYYQEHCTKFLSLRPLESKQAVELATNLLSIFMTFGVPEILESDINKELLNLVAIELKRLGPDCAIVYGQTKHSQNQENIQSVANMLRDWLVENKSSKWSIGLQFIQFQKNCSHNLVIGRSPYKALFGNDPKFDFNISNLPLKIILEEENVNKNIHKKLKTELDYQPSIRCSNCGLEMSNQMYTASMISIKLCETCDKIRESHQLTLEKCKKAIIPIIHKYQVEDNASMLDRDQ